MARNSIYDYKTFLTRIPSIFVRARKSNSRYINVIKVINAPFSFARRPIEQQSTKLYSRYILPKERFTVICIHVQVL
jgi:hypothetical protein